jgi:hypothetical protein
LNTFPTLAAVLATVVAFIAAGFAKEVAAFVMGLVMDDIIFDADVLEIPYVYSMAVAAASTRHIKKMRKNSIIL